MASLQIEKKTGIWQIRFRLGKRAFKRSLETRYRAEAERILDRFHETLELVKRGRIEIPAGADVPTFLLSDGKRTGPVVAIDGVAFGSAIDRYFAGLPVGAKAATTLTTEAIHGRHLRKTIGDKIQLAAITHERLQRYVASRSKSVGGETIRKEIKTFRRVWEWAGRSNLVVGPAPTAGLVFPLHPEREPFRTRGEIEAIIKRTDPDDAGKLALWETLFLSVAEVQEFLKHVGKTAKHPALHPIITFAAWTGARRSELLRSRVEDWNFTAGIVSIRERKKRRDRSLSFRLVPIHAELQPVIQPWIESRETSAVFDWSVHQAVHYWQSIRVGKWSVIAGYHVLRHSFASNLASRGISQAIIDSWLGHTTEEMQRRYRHLFPSDQMTAMQSLTDLSRVLHR